VSQESFFCGVWYDYTIAEQNKNIEGCLYGLMDTVFGAICRAAISKNSAKRTYLRLYPQCPLISSLADALPKKEKKRRIPDFLGITTTSLHSDRQRREHRCMGFWIEGKPLSNVEWSTFDAQRRAKHLFEESIPQLNTQAAFAFSSFPSGTSGDSFYAFLIIDPLYSLLKYTRPAATAENIGDDPPTPQPPEVVAFNRRIFWADLEPENWRFTYEFLAAIHVVMNALQLSLQPSWCDIDVVTGGHYEEPIVDKFLRVSTPILLHGTDVLTISFCFARDWDRS
jgi:hypothetical protein